METHALLALEDVLAARARIAGTLHRTPVVTSASLDALTGLRLAFKAELFQKTGSFKVRGVTNKLATLSEAERAPGLVAMSAGNHAAALAWVAGRHGLRATIVMPQSATEAKVAATRSYGGEVVLTEQPLMDVVNDLRERRGLTLVHPFDDPAIMAGQGTVGLEILDDVPEAEVVIVPVGGGGLISGIATAVKASRPEASVHGVEPEAAPAMTLALAAGEPVTIPHPRTLADGLTAPFAGRHTLASVRRHVDQVVTVAEEAIASATLLLMERMKLYVEPSAAVPLAALLSGVITAPAGTRVVVVLSGGNVDRAALRSLLS